MSEKILVLVRDRQDSNQGEISVLDDPQKAARLVETLLEAGFEQDRIEVFTGHISEFEVSHRPVVALAGTSERAEAAAPPPRAEGDREKAPQASEAAEEAAAPAPQPELHPEPEPEREPEPEPEPRPNVTATVRVEPSEPVVEEEPQEEEPKVAGPVRFSSLFRSA